MNLKYSYPPQTKGTIVIWGLLASFPFGGMAWQVLHYVAGFRQLGFDVWYVEDSGIPLLDPNTLARTADYAANARFLAKNMESVGMGDRWVFRPPGSEDTCLGKRDLPGLVRLYKEADIVINLCGSQWLKDEHLAASCIIYLQTDPVVDQINLAKGNPGLTTELGKYDYLFTYAENLGAPDCLVPDTIYQWHSTRPPVCVEWWQTNTPPPPDAGLTTISNWKHLGHDISWQGKTYRWRKDMQFREFVGLPRRSRLPLELALERIRPDDTSEFQSQGWSIVSARGLSDPDDYRNYIRESKGEFTIAKEQYVIPRTGWFSDRSVCYLAAGRPVITQDTAFDKFIPTGEGLFAFSTEEEALNAIDAIADDYSRHSFAATEIARTYFGTDQVLSDMARKIGIM